MSYSLAFSPGCLTQYIPLMIMKPARVVSQSQRFQRPNWLNRQFGIPSHQLCQTLMKKFWKRFPHTHSLEYQIMLKLFSLINTSQSVIFPIVISVIDTSCQYLTLGLLLHVIFVCDSYTLSISFFCSNSYSSSYSRLLFLFLRK